MNRSGIQHFETGMVQGSYMQGDWKMKGLGLQLVVSQEIPTINLDLVLQPET